MNYTLLLFKDDLYDDLVCISFSNILIHETKLFTWFRRILCLGTCV